MFKMYEKKTYKGTEPVVEINRSGRIFFNRKVVNLLAGNRFARLGYDQENNAIGILVTNENNSSFKVRYTRRGASISAKPFFHHFNIVPEQVVHSAPVMVNEFIVVSLQR